jgi:hypothetical protein
VGKWNGMERNGKGFELIVMRACRLEKRRQAMLNMPKMIQEWKQVSSFMVLVK